jgi:preprotein translocase subunit SecG
MNIPFSFWKTASPKRKRIYSIIFMLALSITATILGTLVQLSAQDAKQLSDSTNGIITDNPTYPSLVGAILLNNFKICLVMFIPIFGAVFGLFVLFSTGVGIRAILDTQSASGASAAISTISPTTAILALVFVGLTFVLEYVSYSIGIAESIWLYRRLTQRRWRELKNTGILIGIVAALLITGALVESWVITAIP